ncbi:MAG: Mut7-C RNAse domain-containing protein [Candidatus Njordarchaeales archaeon]
MESRVIKFIVDEMCGKIVRWLRILGFDAIKITDLIDLKNEKIDDTIVLNKTAITKRILLTKDKELHKRAKNMGLTSVLIRNKNDIASELADIFLDLKINPLKLNLSPRCPKCNGLLIKVDKRKLKNKLPRNIVNKHDDFYECTTCGSIYWYGSHWINIRNVISRISNIVSLEKSQN